MHQRTPTTKSRVARIIFGFENLAQTEVADFGMSLIVDENVLAFKVPVDDVLRMQICQPLSDV